MIVRLARSLLHVAFFFAVVAGGILIMGSATWLYHRLVGASMTLVAEFKRIALGLYDDPVKLMPLALMFVLKSYSEPHRFKVLIASDFVMIEGRWWWQHQYLRRSDVEYVTETPGGGPLMSPAGFAIGNQKNQIFIPAGAENYEQIKGELSQWAPAANPPA